MRAMPCLGLVSCPGNMLQYIHIVHAILSAHSLHGCRCLLRISVTVIAVLFPREIRPLVAAGCRWRDLWPMAVVAAQDMVAVH